MSANKLWLRNDVQFPRLIAEILATQELNVAALAESMDLSHDELNSLFERAQHVWDEVVKPKSITPGPAQHVLLSVDGSEGYFESKEVRIILPAINNLQGIDQTQVQLTITPSVVVTQVWEVNAQDPDGVDLKIGDESVTAQDIIARMTSEQPGDKLSNTAVK